jgi:hypothetical protein
MESLEQRDKAFRTLIEDYGFLTDTDIEKRLDDGNKENPQYFITIDDSWSESAYLLLHKITDWDADYGVVDEEEISLRFSDHALPAQYTFGRKLYSYSKLYTDEYTDGTSFYDAVQRVLNLTNRKK